MTQRFYQKATVQAAFVGGLVAGIPTILVAVAYIWSNHSAVKRQNTSYINEINNLKQKNQELTAEVQRLETQLTPFKTIALEKFTGSEQEALRKLANELRDLKERIDPFKKPIASITAHVEVGIISDEKVNTRYMNKGGYLAFIKNRQPLLLIYDTKSWARQNGSGQVFYKADFVQIQVEHSTMGQPVETLQTSDLIQVKFNVIPENSHVITGKASVVINGDMRLEFEIPPQQMQLDLVLIRDVKGAFLNARQSINQVP